MNQSVIHDIGAGEFEAILALIQYYFDGLYRGDTSLLRSIFHDDAILKSPGLRRTLDEWLDAVKTRPIPFEEGQHYSFKVISIEVIQDQAMVKLECPLFNYFYIDFLGLLKENGRWLIVNKMYTDVKAASQY